MVDWGIERNCVGRDDNDRREFVTRELLGFKACGLLGAAGLGKTYKLDSLLKILTQNGVPGVMKRFVEVSLDLTGQSLHTGLTDLSNKLREGAAHSVVLLDALDEAMIPRRAGAHPERQRPGVCG